eukprot:637992-Lingulodinium_polyedra.AAC.1
MRARGPRTGAVGWRRDFRSRLTPPALGPFSAGVVLAGWRDGRGAVPPLPGDPPTPEGTGVAGQLVGATLRV